MASKMLVNDGNSANIIFRSTFENVDHQIQLILDPVNSFTGDSLTPRGKITLHIIIEEDPSEVHTYMEFLVSGSWSVYHGVLKGPFHKEIRIVTSIHHLKMNFP
ncbi:Uncharacterized protein Adt_35245 [Abeliophyllum distichum]|uniref:Uncharacterized protein n=1 Tax=Abeliophyllum distichum TaxID=126358 RepID=A0ABD1QF37_9LAMI